ncbi:hypothetical protein J6590_061297 [Homalodisca vitripennis]|nr:hypothetical protein J6590_061297 [Homalodisca vitripennis]
MTQRSVNYSGSAMCTNTPLELDKAEKKPAMNVQHEKLSLNILFLHNNANPHTTNTQTPNSSWMEDVRSFSIEPRSNAKCHYRFPVMKTWLAMLRWSHHNFTPALTSG